MANPNEDRARDIAARGGQEEYEFEKFKARTGRSDKNPYGDAGMFGADVDYRAGRPGMGNFGMSQKG